MSGLIVGDALYGLRSASIQHEIRLLEQMANVGACVMAGYRVVRVAKQRFTIFGRYACRSQTTRERMAKIVHANQWQAGLISRLLQPLLFILSMRLPL